MSNPINLNLNKLKKQLNNGRNINVIYKKPIRINKKIVRNVSSSTKLINKTSNKNLSSKNYSKEDSMIWTFLYIILLITIIFFILILIYNLYMYFQESTQQYLNKKSTFNIENRIKNSPKGVIMDKEGAPISIEYGGNMADNKYLELYNSDDFIKRSYYPSNNQYINGNYKNGIYDYPRQYINNDINGTYSQSDDGVTKIYYQNNMSSDRQQLNQYINKQNDYIRNINNRVRQINTNRMFTPEYSRDKLVLSELREYERQLANKVNSKVKNQPYLPDQKGYY